MMLIDGFSVNVPFTQCKPLQLPKMATLHFWDVSGERILLMHGKNKKQIGKGCQESFEDFKFED
jgi:hypothetical protein